VAFILHAHPSTARPATPRTPSLQILNPDFRDYEMLRDKVAWLLCDRLEDIDREFELGLDLGCGRGHLGEHTNTDLVHRLVQCDISDQALAKWVQSGALTPVGTRALVEPMLSCNCETAHRLPCITNVTDNALVCIAETYRAVLSPVPNSGPSLPASLAMQF